MKNKIKKLCGSLALITSLMFVGCDSNDDKASSVEVMTVSPLEQYVQDSATIEGSGLNQVQYVFVGQIESNFTVEGNTLTFEIPTTATLGKNVVTLAMKDNYRVTTEIGVLKKPIPALFTITPSAAAAGENIRIYGENLENNPQVKIGGVNATVVSSTSSQLVVTVPTVASNAFSSEIEITTTFGNVISNSTFYASSNLLLNSEMELGTGDNFTNWNKYNGGAAMVSTTANGEVYNGRALKATGDGRDAWRTQLASDLVDTTIGNKYLVYMWIKGATGTGNMRFSTNPSALYSGNFNITNQWQQISWEFTANAAQTRVVLDMGATATTYFVDNITLIAR